ncbi:hypothetical protein OIO90_006447 [Microbotryomycetes sp. JL221]|nr:hypothetical protein OIO90_006447 [Microbotryomycetes sp. JL221]
MTSTVSISDVAFSPSVHQFDDPDELESAAPLATFSPEPARNSTTPSETWPTSPRSMVASMSSQPELSDYSPSPSIASVRMAQLVKGFAATKTGIVQARQAAIGFGRDKDTLARVSIVTDRSAGTNSLHLASVDEDELSTDSKDHSRASQVVEMTKATQSVANSTQSLDPLLHEINRKHGLPKSSSAESVASWRENLDAAVKEMAATGADTTAGSEDDVMIRMRSILGPKMKILSKAPWDGEGLDGTNSEVEDDRSQARQSDLECQALAPCAGASPALLKDELKLRANSKSKSFSILTSRKSSQTDRAREGRTPAMRGLGLDLETTHSPVKTSPDRSSKQSPTTLGDSFPDLNSLTSPLIASPARAANSNGLLSPSNSLTFFKQSKAAKTPPPIHLGKAGACQQPVRSAPPSMSSFAAIAPMDRSDSGTSLTARPQIGSSSSSSLSNNSGPTTPTTLSQVFPSSLNVHGDSYFSMPPKPSPNAPRVKLISLDEARQRESDRIAAAAARRKEQMTPVENIAKADKSPTQPTRSKTRETSSGAESDRSRSRSSSTPLSAIAQSSTTPPTTAPVNSSKTLKPKRSGFLRRMMGGDKTDLPVPPLPTQAASDALASLPSPEHGNITLYYGSSFAPTSEMASILATSPIASTDSARSPSSTSQVTFKSVPPVREKKNLGPLAAPSLSLRPVSMAFSAGFASDLMANENGGIRSPARAAETPSVVSVTSADQESLFDRDELESIASSSMLPMTPATPGFETRDVVSPVLAPVAELATSPSSSDLMHRTRVGHASLQSDYNRARKEWHAKQAELEHQIRALHDELESYKLSASTPNVCLECGSVMNVQKPSPSIIQRSRFSGHGGSGVLYASGLAM